MAQETLSVREAAKQLRCTLKYVYDLLYSGRLAGKKVGREWRIPPDAIRTRAKQREEGE